MDRADVVMTAWDFPLVPGSVVVGDLVADALEMDEGVSPWKREKALRLVFFPGSRPGIRKASLRFLSEVKDTLETLLNDLEIVTALSPFTAQSEVEEWEKEGLNPSLSGTRVVLEGADLALTQPGTNTLELMHVGVPAVVAVPFYFLEHVPLGGLKGIFLQVPILGKMIKDKLLRKASDRRGFLAWPNRIAKEMIMREVVGDVTPADLAELLAELLLDERQRLCQRERLRALPKRYGAAENILSIIEERIS